MKEDVDRVKSVQVRVVVPNRVRVESELVWFGGSRVCVGGEVKVGGSWRE